MTFIDKKIQEFREGFTITNGLVIPLGGPKDVKRLESFLQQTIEEAQEEVFKKVKLTSLTVDGEEHARCVEVVNLLIDKIKKDAKKKELL